MYKKEALLRDTGLFVLGLEGVFWSEGKVVEGAAKFLEAVRKTKREYLLYTNQNSIAKKKYIDMLEQLGCSVKEEQLLTSVDVAIRYLNLLKPGKKVYLAGTPAMEEELRRAGILISEEEAELVLIGSDTTFTFDRLNRVCKLIRDGAEFLATHGEMVSSQNSQQIPDCGALCAAITAVTGKAPGILGLPHKAAVEMILDYTGIRPDYIAFVGDRLDVEIAAGVENSMMGFLVLTGETTLEDVFTSGKKPDLIFSSVKEMEEIMEKWVMG